MAPPRDNIAAPRPLRLLAMAGVFSGAAAIGLGGCYERVVRASGPGTSGVKVYEPNLKESRVPLVDDVEDAVFGKKEYGVRKQPK